MSKTRRSSAEKMQAAVALFIVAIMVGSVVFAFVLMQ